MRSHNQLARLFATLQELKRPAGAVDADETMRTTLTSLGFQPRLEPGPPGRLTYCLGNCPYREAVRENQNVVCTLHRGITRGLLDVLAPSAKLEGFVPRDPDTAGCLIQVAGMKEN